LANINTAYDAVVSMTVTNLNSLANSATAGWQSAAVDNSSLLYLDALVVVQTAMANTAPANSRSVFVFAYGSVDGGTLYTRPASGSESTITLVDVTANAQSLKLIGQVPYTTQNEVMIGGPFSVAAAFGGVLPQKWGLVLINHTGAAINSSGNSVKYQPVYATVA
jgi:hypothetical protein